jgi:hypothetical protein
VICRESSQGTQEKITMMATPHSVAPAQLVEHLASRLTGSLSGTEHSHAEVHCELQAVPTPPLTGWPGVPGLVQQGGQHVGRAAGKTLPTHEHLR